MSAIITNKFRVASAGAFKDQFLDSVSDENYYLFIGKPREWDDELTPPAPENDLYEELRAWESMMGLKKVVEIGTSHGIPRFDWDASGNTIYVQYSDKDENIFLHPTDDEVEAANLAGDYTPGTLYVMTDEYHVFKCLGNGGGVKSTDKPLKPANSLDIVETSDGYRWKYMYTVSTSDALKFLSDAWMPVKLLTEDDDSFQWLVQEGAEDGVINDIHVTAGGSGYSNVRPTPEALVTATPTTVQLNAAAQSYATGDGFFNGSTLWVEDGAASGEHKLIIGYVHSTNIVTLESAFSVTPTAGDDYTILPTVTISGNGSGAVGKAHVDEVTPTDILSVSVVSGGTEYRYATAAISGAGGTLATLDVAIPPSGGHGANPVLELGGSFVLLNVELAYNEGLGDFPISNDYRQVGLVKNAVNFGTTDLATATTRIASQRLVVTPLSGTFLPDEDISAPSGSDTAVGFLVDWNTEDNIISFIQDIDSGFVSFSGAVGQTVTGSISGATATIDEIADPEIERYVGDIIYLENRRAILRAPDQKESILLIIQF